MASEHDHKFKKDYTAALLCLIQGINTFRIGDTLHSIYINFYHIASTDY